MNRRITLLKNCNSQNSAMLLGGKKVTRRNSHTPFWSPQLGSWLWSCGLRQHARVAHDPSRWIGRSLSTHKPRSMYNQHNVRLVTT